MEINWTISSLECKTNENGLSNVVYKAHWKCTAIEIIEEIEYSFQLQGSLILPSPNPNSFTLYESLTEEQVITWVKDTFGVVGVQEIYDLLQNNINEQINPTIISLTPPWE